MNAHRSSPQWIAAWLVLTLLALLLLLTLVGVSLGGLDGAEQGGVREPSPDRVAALDSTGWREIWASEDQTVALYVAPESGGRWVCPRRPGSRHQPFCRRFAAPLLGVCQLEDGLQLVLGNGDIHHVDRALLGIGGDFKAVHPARVPLDLEAAWVPGSRCQPSVHASPVVGLDRTGALLHFDGLDWTTLSRGAGGGSG